MEQSVRSREAELRAEVRGPWEGLQVANFEPDYKHSNEQEVKLWRAGAAEEAKSSQRQVAWGQSSQSRLLEPGR